MTLSSEPDNWNFRGFHWYETLSTVKMRESARFLEHRHQEFNVAVRPAKPWKVQHLYFEDELLGEPVTLLYRFDLNCNQLYKAEYIFSRVLDGHTINKLVKAIKVKHGIELEEEYSNDMYLASGTLADGTHVQILGLGQLHFHRGKTILYYQTKEYRGMWGWADGAEPVCEASLAEQESLIEKL